MIGLQYSDKGLSSKNTDVSEWYEIPYTKAYTESRSDPVKIANDYLNGDSKKNQTSSIYITSIRLFI